MTINITHAGEISLGGITIPCYVTEKGQRLISSRRMQEVLKIEEDVDETKRSGGARFKRFLGRNSLKPLINKESEWGLFSPVLAVYQKRKIRGSQAEDLLKFCDFMLEAKKQGTLKTKRQKIVADQAEVIVRAVAHVGLIALIDEATGYQNIRKNDALKLIAEAYLSKERAVWEKCFPDEFYQQLFRLRGWTWPIAKKPMKVGQLTKDLVYKRLAPGIVTELETMNPCRKKWQRKAKHHQYLSDNLGHPALSQHLHALTVLMRSASNWKGFYQMVQMALPVKDDAFDL